MARTGPPELEVLFRICSAVQSAVRRETTSPHGGDVVAMGAYGSPTEQIDRVAEEQILAILEAEGVDWDVLSEEAGLIARGGTRTLVVDPVDGSHNVLRSLPFATISLALGRGDLDGVELGVVHDLYRGATYWGIRGQGAYRDGRRIRTRGWDARSEIFFVNLGRHSTPRAVALAERGRRIRSLGCASYEMTMVAEGGADLYFFENDTENRNLRVTDIAAAYRILAEAGGGAWDARMRPLGAFPLELNRHTSVFAWGDRAFAERSRAEGAA